MFKLIYFVPESHLENTKQAIFATGAGTLDTYQQCCWQVKGQGQFQPTTDSNPTIGKASTLSVIDEFYVEVICNKKNIEQAVQALKKAHPYETVAYQVIQLENY